MDKIAPRRLVRHVRWEREVESYLKYCESSVLGWLGWHWHAAEAEMEQALGFGLGNARGKIKRFARPSYSFVRQKR
jgi:hypothetical protein